MANANTFLSLAVLSFTKKAEYTGVKGSIGVEAESTGVKEANALLLAFTRMLRLLEASG